MSSNVGNTPSIANYQATDVAKPSQNAQVTKPNPAPLTPAQQADVLRANQETRREQQEAFRNQLMGSAGQTFADGYGADDDESKASMHKMKQGAAKAGVKLSDKALHAMHLATKDDPGTQKLVSKLADPKDPDTNKLVTQLQTGRPAQLTMLRTAFESSPAASLPETDAPGSNTSAQGTAAQTSLASTSPENNVDQAVTGQPAAQPPLANGGVASTPTTAAGTGTAAATGTQTASTTTSSASTASTGGLVDKPGDLKGGNWSSYVAMAMFGATKEMQAEKKNELNQIKKFNSMLDQVNKYVTNTLMPAQQDLQTRTVASKDKNKSSDLEVTIYNPINPDTSDCDMNPNTGEAILRNAPGSPEPPAAVKVTQDTLTHKISEADQWRTSISNNQQLHSSNFQSLDTQVTSFMNMITALYKNVNETQTGVARNLT